MTTKNLMFSRYQLVEFGNYLLSKERRKIYQQEGDVSRLEERLSTVNHADVENYIESLTKETVNLSNHELLTDNIPRRIRIDLMEPAELAIRNAIHEVEAIGADVKLTDAVITLSKAQELVADFIDENVIKSLKTLGSNR